MIVNATSGLQTFRELHYSYGPEDSAYAGIDYACRRLCLYVCIYKVVRLKSELQHNVTWSDTAWSPCRLCYRPVALSLHLPFTAVYFTAKEILWTCAKCRFRFLSFLNWVNLKLHDVKLLKLGNVCVLGYLDFVNLLLFQKKRSDEIDLFPSSGPHRDLFPVSCTVTNAGRDLPPREEKKSNVRNSVFCSEYEMVNRVQKGNNAKCQGSHSTSLVRVAKAICIWMARKV
jgi:hypothetical protein